MANEGFELLRKNAKIFLARQEALEKIAEIVSKRPELQQDPELAGLIEQVKRAA